MRISDWSSDVCSSDLSLLGGVKGCVHLVEMLGPMATVAFQTIGPSRVKSADGVPAGEAKPTQRPKRIDSCHALASDGRSAERRVGKEWVSTGRTRGSSYHTKIHKKKTHLKPYK